MHRAGRWGRSLCAAAALASTLGCGGQKAEWPQFRGPAGLGFSDATALPAKWGKGSANIRWSTALPGRGNSSPVVAAGRVYLTTVIEQPPDGAAGGAAGDASLDRAVLALDFATGKLLWQTTVFSGPRLKSHWLNTGAAPTAVTDGESVYAYFGSHLARLTRDGTVTWSREIDPAYARFVHYGVASSPILVGDTVVVVQDQEEGDNDDLGWMAAYDVKTGDQVWRQQWDNTCCSYSTPLLWQRPGADQELLFAHSGTVAGYDPRTGERLWRHDHEMTQFVGGLVAQGDVICALGGAHHNRGNLCIRVTGPSRGAKVERLWYEPGRAPETSSAVLYGGRLYAVTMGGVMSCYDPLSGKLHWAERLGSGNNFRASLVAGDGKVYAHATAGATSVIDATTDEYRVLARNDLEEKGIQRHTGDCRRLSPAAHVRASRLRGERGAGRLTLEGQPGWLAGHDDNSRHSRSIQASSCQGSSMPPAGRAGTVSPDRACQIWSAAPIRQTASGESSREPTP